MSGADGPYRKVTLQNTTVGRKNGVPMSILLKRASLKT